jgi:hypothetical protein
MRADLLGPPKVASLGQLAGAPVAGLVAATLVAASLVAGCESAVVRPPPPVNTEPAPPEAGVSLPDAGGASPGVGNIGPLDGGTPGTAEAGAGAANEQVLVYAHSGSDLFSVVPATLEIRRIGNFTRINAAGRTQFLNNVTDIAVDARGRIVGLTFTQLLEIDARTAVCTVIAPLPADADFNGLSWLRAEGGAEILVATGLDGRVFRLDPTTGAASVLGQLGGALQSSGDLVSVASYGTLVTLRGAPADPANLRPPGPDLLARLDPVTGAATVIGPTGFSKVWGLGFWGNRVFGFTVTGEFILIDPRTGAGTLVRREGAFPFWGAGVTTSVPVID